MNIEKLFEIRTMRQVYRLAAIVTLFAVLIPVLIFSIPFAFLGMRYMGFFAVAFIPAFSENAANAQMNMPLVEGTQIKDAISVHLNRAVIGEITPTEALNASADDMYKILTDAGYDVKEPNHL